MKRRDRSLFIVLLVAVTAIILLPAFSHALTDAQIKAATQIVNLEAIPVWFRPGQPVDFIVTLKYNGGTQGGFDVGVLHNNRIVGWETGKVLKTGMNIFKLHDANFRGEPGAYFIHVRFKGQVFTQRSYATRMVAGMFTIDPKAVPPPQQGLTDAQVRAATQIANLDALPVWFRPGQPIDFVATVRYNGPVPQGGFDVGVLHGNRVVGWQNGKVLNRGMNTFKLRDANFRGDPGAYIVQIRYKGQTFAQKPFTTRVHKVMVPTDTFTIDPAAAPPR